MNVVTLDTEPFFTLEGLEDGILALLKNVGGIVVCVFFSFSHLS